MQLWTATLWNGINTNVARNYTGNEIKKAKWEIYISLIIWSTGSYNLKKRGN